MSNTAALQIVAASTDILFTTKEDVFITGLCRTVTGIGCTSVHGIPQTNAASDCDVMSGRVISLYDVTSVQMTRLWKILGNSTAAEQACGGSTMSTLHLVVITCVLLMSIVYCVFSCQHKLFSMPFQAEWFFIRR